MEQFNKKERPSFYETYEGFRSHISAILGIIVTILGILVVFFVSSLEGQKELKASNKDNAILMSMWRDNNEAEYPENSVSIIKYKDKDYYFIVDTYDVEGNILKWYFAYDAGIGYVFSDLKFYILTGITLIISIFVAQINYTTSRNGAMETTKFLKTLVAYQESKSKVHHKTQFIPHFCSYKNKQLYEEAKEEIVQSANISYNLYISKDFDVDKLEDWQKKQLEQIKKIKIERITSSDLLQEKSDIKKRWGLLPIAPDKHKRNYLWRSLITKTSSSLLSGMTVAFGVVFGNWVLGITYGFTVLVSAILSGIAGADYANNGLRQRYIAKADLLNEFHNMSDYFKEDGNEQKQQI